MSKGWQEHGGRRQDTGSNAQCGLWPGHPKLPGNLSFFFHQVSVTPLAFPAPTYYNFIFPGDDTQLSWEPRPVTDGLH